eukprot:TRINITY_DN48446_c0_g1_i1.p1 TRINITY_DN48446_c0_g1~~TRINITY_DN48446_c0_g1_i1.p1  ORF type:complete len:414 (-),score=88.20 TRINITY_DN48446_c0_g1_i1:111-1352(-)
MKERLRALQHRLREEQRLRRRHHNQVQDMKGAIRVFCRIRPLDRMEASAGEQEVVRKFDAFSVELTRTTSRGLSCKSSYQFDTIFDGGSGQKDIFADCRDVVQSAIDGYNVTVFAYGQEGAGKTHTLYGTEEDPGLAPRAASFIFECVSREREASTTQICVKAHIVEVYKNEVYDLLASKRAEEKKSLEVKKDVSRDIMVADGVSEMQVKSSQDILRLLAAGERKRVGSVGRSHLLLSILIESAAEDSQEGLCGKITFCDLAGPERSKNSAPASEVRKETIEVNKSLTALGDVIEAISKGAKVIPYRSHKLTMLVQDSLGGSGKTLMFVNCSPAASCAEETSLSFKWAGRARQVTTDVKKNADSKEVARLKQVIAKMSQAQQDVNRGTSEEQAADASAEAAAARLLADGSAAA